MIGSDGGIESYLFAAAPGVAALALSGDWASEFLSGADSASSSAQAGLGDTADADWTKEFITDATGASGVPSLDP